MTSGVPIWAYVLGVLGVGGIITSIVAYLSARRTTSGRIDTTEAATLGEEARSVRTELRDEVVALRKDVKDLHDKVDELEDRNRECQRESDRMRVMIEGLEQQITTIKRWRAR